MTRAFASAAFCAALAISGCGGGGSAKTGALSGNHYEYKFVVPAAAVGSLEGAKVLVGGQERGTVDAVRSLGPTASVATAQLTLTSPLHVDARTRVCEGRLVVGKSTLTRPAARNGYTFPLTQTTVTASCG
jgi:hypothetical protein